MRKPSPPLAGRLGNPVTKERHGMLPVSQSGLPGMQWEHAVASPASRRRPQTNRGTGRSEATKPGRSVLDGGKSNVEPPSPGRMVSRRRGSGGQNPSLPPFRCMQMAAPAHASNPRMGQRSLACVVSGGGGVTQVQGRCSAGHVWSGLS